MSRSISDRDYPLDQAARVGRRAGRLGTGLLWLVVLLILGLGEPAFGQSDLIKQIVITNLGPVRIGETLVRANIRSKEGEPYNRNVINEDVRNLYATGYFANIAVTEERSLDGYTLYYLLRGKLKLIDLQIEGNKKLSDRKLRKKITVKVGEPLDEHKLFSDKLELVKLYQKKGYTETKIDYVIDADERAGTGKVIFEIQETPKVKIDDVVFVGSAAFSQRKLRHVVKTRRHWWMSWITQSGTLKKDQLEEDKDRLAAFYQDAGYIDFELKNIEYDYQTPRLLVLRFIVSEGRQYKVGAVGFKGFTLFPTNQVSRKLKMNVGSTFTLKGLTTDRETITDLYGAKGYIDARILARRKANTQTGTMDILYEVDEGNKSFIEKIEIRGNTKTKDRVLRRELAVSPGEVFDMTRVKLSQRRLEGLNFFETVLTQPEPTDVPDRRNLVISVAEKTTGHFNIGAGFSSIDALVGFVEVTQGNFDLFKPPSFMGGGQKMRLRAAIGTQRQDYLLTFTEPWFLGRKLQFTFDLYHRELNYVSLNDLYDESRSGGRVGFTKALGSDYLIGGLNYTLEQVNIKNVDEDASDVIKADEGKHLISKVGAFVAYDTRNNVLLPDRGYRVELRGELAGGPFEGHTDYYKGELRGSRYIRGFFKGHILELLARGGYVDSYGDSESVPIFDRFFLGGLTSLRGYRYREVGPVDENEEPIGGNYYWFGSAEYSIPVIERVRFAVFYDIGMAYSFQDQYNIGNYNDNWGVGIRLNLPIGPLRFDYGIPINDSDGINDSSGRFQFSAGYTRDF
jgi:outer membrane protein insertion porin family